MKNKITIKIVIPAIFLIIISTYCSCSSPTEPGLTPGRRDYVWTVDTLNYPNDPMYRMWGSSPADVWTTSSGDHDKSISHFDGVNWSSYGVPLMNVPSSIFGFSRDNIYVGTGGGGIWHFDGNNWTNVANLTKDGHNDIVFDNIWGSSPADIYATGAYPDTNGLFNKAVIAHFSKGKWEMINTDNLFGLVEHLFKSTLDQNAYLQIIKWSNSYDSTFIYQYDQKNYIELYRDIRTTGSQADISLINNEIYFILGNKIERRKGNEFQTLLNVNNSRFNQKIWGRNSNDLFLLMTDGLAHYNGTDTQYLFHFNKPTTLIFGAALFEKEVFLLVYEYPTGLNLIYHGKLK